MPNEDDYQSYADEMNVAGRERVHRDHHLAISGIQAGQQETSILAQNTPAKIQKKKDEEYATLSALMRHLMSNSSYAAYYNETIDMLTEAENAADNAMKYFAMKHVQSQQSLQEALANSTILKDHGAVFKDADDNVRTADGAIITDPVLLDSIIWKDNSTTYEDFVEKREAVNHYSKSYDDAYTYRNDTLGKVRETMENQDKPVTQDKMKELREVIADQPDAITSFTENSQNSYASNEADFTLIADAPKIKIM